MKETPSSPIRAHTADPNASDKQKSCFLAPVRKPRVAYVDEWTGSNVISPGDGYK